MTTLTTRTQLAIGRPSTLLDPRGGVAIANYPEVAGRPITVTLRDWNGGR